MSQLIVLGCEAQATEMKKDVENFEFELAQNVLTDICHTLNIELKTH